MHLSAFVVCHGVLLQPFGDDVVAHHDRLVVAHRLAQQVKDVEHLAGVASGKAEQCVGLDHLHLALLQLAVACDGAMQQLVQVGVCQRLQHVDLRSRQQRADDFKRRVFGGGANQRGCACFHGGKQRVLLRLVEAVDFVDEKDWAVLAEHARGVAFA